MEQATEGIGLEVPKDRIIHYCQQFGLNLRRHLSRTSGLEGTSRDQELQAARNDDQRDALLMSVSLISDLTQRR